MKINKVYKLVALMAGVATLATSCIQETFPMESAATTEQVGESPFAADGMVSSIPTILVKNMIFNDHSDFGYPSILCHLDHAIGEVFPSNYAIGGNPYYDRFQVYQYQFYIGPADGYCAQIWYHYYQFLKPVNDLISVCGDGDLLKHQRGLAKAYRGLYYLDLARLYDPLYAVSTERPEYQAALAAIEGLTVPLIDENSTEETARNNPRLPREEMFQFILADLTGAEADLQDYTATSKNLPSLAVVYGLLARTYLWLGGFEEGKYTDKYPTVLTGNAAYQKAAEYARKAIDASGCRPLTEAEYCDKKNGFNTINSSWMWGMIQSADTIFSTLYTWAAHMCCESYWGYGGLTRPGVRKATYERMSDTDFRKKLIVGPNTTYADYKNVTNLSEAEWKEFHQEKLPMSTYAHLKFRTGNGGEMVDSATGNIVDIPLMRVEEMYLIEAEAVAHYDEATGKQLITSFMSNRDPNYQVPAGVSGDALVEEIIFQKRCELWGEGILFYDFKRLDYGLDNAYDGTNAPPGMDFYSEGRCPAWNMCIPIEEVQQNPALLGKNNPDPSYTLKPKSDE